MTLVSLIDPPHLALRLELAASNKQNPFTDKTRKLGSDLILEKLGKPLPTRRPQRKGGGRAETRKSQSRHPLSSLHRGARLWLELRLVASRSSVFEALCEGVSVAGPARDVRFGFQGHVSNDMTRSVESCTVT